MEPEQKALAFNSCAREIRALADPGAFAALLRVLPADTRGLVERPPLPIEWLPYRHSWSLIRNAHEIVFGGDVTRTMQVSRRAVVADLNVVHKLFIRLATPEFVLERAARLWASYWRHNGTVRIERTGAQTVKLHYVDMQHATPLFWAMQCGTLHGLATATGFPNAEVRVVEGWDSPHRCVVSVCWR